MESNVADYICDNRTKDYFYIWWFGVGAMLICSQLLAKRPWCSPITCCWMPVECVAFAYSIVNAVICCVWALASLIYVMLLMNLPFEPPTNHSLGDSVVITLIILNFIGSTIALLFAILLCVGLSKKKPKYVLAYLVYGLVSVTLSVLGTVGSFGTILASSPSGDVGILTLFALLTFCGTGLYFGMLALVYQSYKVISGQADIAEHKRFHNDNIDNA